jgi:DNA-binding HxlR family transcriptional regulator
MQAVAGGVTRPGALERHIEGISTKVLSERLRKLAAFGLLERHVSGGKPLRTEYTLTPAGRKVVKIVAQIRALDGELRREVQAAARPPGQPERK